MVGGETTVSVFLIFAALFGRITEWEHFPHYGGGSGIIVRDNLIVAATSGGVLFAHYSESGNELVVDSGWTSPGKLSYDRVSHVTYDDSGNLWVSMNGGGIDMFTPAGEKTIYLRIIRPDQVVLGSPELEMIDLNDEQIPASSSRIITYENTDLPVSIFWTNDGEIVPGEHIVELYCEGALIATASFVLK
jgi:hypothetical protein